MWTTVLKPSSKNKYVRETSDFLRARRTADGTVEVQRPHVFHRTGGGEFTWAELQAIFARAPKGVDPEMSTYDTDTGCVTTEFSVWRACTPSPNQLAAVEAALPREAR